jgi:hypothetical protein
MFERMADDAASFTICVVSRRAKRSDLKVYTPIVPRPNAHSALIEGFASFETPSINMSSPCAPKFLMQRIAHSLTFGDLSCKH